MTTLAVEDHQLLLAQVERLADQALSGLDTALDESRFSRDNFRNAATNAGLMCAPGAHTEAMLWMDGMEAFSLDALRTVARGNASAALMLYRETAASSLLASMEDRADICRASLLPEGVQGPGRAALAHWLQDRPLADGDRVELADNFSGQTPRAVFAAEDADLIFPVWSEDALHWAHLPSGSGRSPCEHPHGMEALGMLQLDPADRSLLCRIEPAQFADTLHRHYRALLAIGAGLVDRAREVAVDYADQRRQGGRVIREWPAVRALIADIRDAADGLESVMQHSPITDPQGLARTVRIFLRLSRDVCTACNQCMQVLGGIGYMRDLPAEKLVREANVLRRCSGSPTLLAEFAASLEEG